MSKTTNQPAQYGQPLLNSLIKGPLLVEQLPEANPFPHQALALPASIPPFNHEQKLGHLYEDVLACLLNAADRFDLLAQNLQIQKDRHATLGELDFLVRDLSTNQLIHLELATKFYLVVHEGDTTTLPGPDARDNYHRKLSRLRTHQLLLPRQHRVHFPTPFRNEPIESQHLIYGCLFDPILAKEPHHPEFSNPQARRGKWLHHDELSVHFPDLPEFEIIPKPLWPVPLSLISDLKLERWEPTSQIDRCLMVRIPGDTTPYFIAPNGYPDQNDEATLSTQIAEP